MGILNILDIDDAVGWGAIMDANLAALRAQLVEGPFKNVPIHRDTSNGDADPNGYALSDFDPADYQYASVFLVDPQAGKGPRAYSNGTNWLYESDSTAVTIVP